MIIKNIFKFLFIILEVSGFFINNNFIKKFQINSNNKNIDITNNIIYNLSYNERKIINKIDGFYGLVGPEIKNSTKIITLYDLFTGNGVINGVFFNKGNITFIKRFIRTDKFIHEEIINTLDIKNFFMNFYKINILFPNMIGTANTALILINKKLYSLFERDQPYLLDIDFLNKDIKTIKKIYIPNLLHFSGHSKFKNNIIETIDYKILENKVTYHQLDINFQSILKKDFSMKYFPIVHDFISTNNSVIIFDSPLKIDFIDTKKVILDITKPTFIYVMNKNNLKIDEYYLNNSLYVFHFADFYEDEQIIEIYASLYDNLDFTSLNIKGRYRKIVIDKKTKLVSIEKNIELENLNLEFPVKYENKIIFKNLENGIINSFIICEKLRIFKKIIIPNKKISGEPSIKYIDRTPYLICFCYDLKCGYIVIINLNNNKIIEIPIYTKINVGFHSIFISK